MVKAETQRTVSRRERADALVEAAGRQNGPAFKSQLNIVVERNELAVVVAALAEELHHLRAGIGAIAAQATALVGTTVVEKAEACRSEP